MLEQETVSTVFKLVVEYLKSRGDVNAKEIKSFQLSTACDTGDNFLGLIYAVSVSVAKAASGGNGNGSHAGTTDKGQRYEQINLIAKSQLFDKKKETEDGGDEAASKKFFWNALFTKERLIYQDLLFEMERVGKVRMSPKFHYFYTEAEDYACILLENLITSGYYIPDFQTLSFEQCEQVMKNLANFHALSLVVEGESGKKMLEKFEFLQAELFFSPMMEHVMKPYVQNSYRGVLEICENFHPDLVEPLKKLNKDKTLWERGCEYVGLGKTSFSCVCHGDARLKNMFLISSNVDTPTTTTTTASQRDGGNKEQGDFRFIDFQMTRYASPITDLIYFLYVSTSGVFRKAHAERLLKIYYQEFMRVLDSFPHVPVKAEARAWTLETFFREYQDLQDFAILTTVAFTPTIYLRPQDIGESMREGGEDFLIQNRARIIADVACRNHVLRTRILDGLEDAFRIKSAGFQTLRETLGL